MLTPELQAVTDRERAAVAAAHEAWPTESRDPDAATYRAHLIAIAHAQASIERMDIRRARAA